MTSSHLLLVRASLRRCPECHQPLSYYQASLTVDFEDDSITFELDAGYCGTDDIWFVDLVLLEDALEEEGLDLLDAEAFSVNDAPVDVAIWMGETVGVIPWDIHRQAMEVSSDLREQKPARPEDVQRLPQVNERWFIVQAPGFYYLEEGKPTLGHVGLLVTEQHLVRSVDVHGDALGPTELVDLIVAGCAKPPQELSAVRPQVVLVDDPMVAEQLTQELADKGLDIRVEAGDVSPAREALQALKEALNPEPVPSYFIHYSQSEVKTFFKAANDFFRARPWEVIDGTKFVSFQRDGGPWRYANVMGQAGEEFGLATFRDWLEVCKATNNPETLLEALEMTTSGQKPLPKSLLATGGAESLSLSPLEALAPEDAAYLKKLKIKPSWRKAYATVHRYTPYGMETPLLDITSYTGLMTVLAERAHKVRGNQVTSLKATVDTPKGKLTVRYPAKGDEDSSRQDYYQFRVPFHLGARSETPGEYLWAEVRAPGEAKWHRVMAALTREAKAIPHIFPWVSEVMQGDYALWLDQAPVKEPSPTVEQLASQQGLTLKMGRYEWPELQFNSIPRPSKADIQVRFLDEQSGTPQLDERR